MHRGVSPSPLSTRPLTISVSLIFCQSSPLPAISRVTCDGHSADFAVHDHLTGVGLSDARDVHLFPELKRKLYAASSDGAGGEVGIVLPPQVQIESSRSADSTSAAAGEVSTSSQQELAPIVIRIDYTLQDPVDGIHCIRPNPSAPWRQPHMYTSPTCSDYSRCWVPCVDNLWERNTWEFAFVVPKTIAAHNSSASNTNEDPISVVCTGDLVEKTAHPHHSSKLIYSFLQAAPTSVHHVGFVAGCLSALDLSIAPGGVGGAEDGGELQSVAFCLPGREDELQASVRVVRQAIDFYSRELGSYPFGSYKVVFVEDAITDLHSASTLSIVSADLLHPSTVIDQALETRQHLAHALAVQWVGMNIIQRSWSDTWLINGLALYISGLFWRKLMGNNEYRFRLRKDCDRCCAWDVGMPPICQIGSNEPPDSALLPFINLKAPLVLHILDRKLCKAGASVGLGRVIPKVLLQAITGELPNNTLSTSSFLRTCRKVSGVDLRSFVEQWIYGSGCPRFFINSHFNRKKLTIEIHVRQESPALQFAEYRPELAIGSNPVKFFEGQMTIRIHEADGRPYEHVLDIKTPHKRYDVPFNTKYKRVRRNTKRFQARQAAAVAAAEGDQDAAEAIGMIDLGFSLALWENEEQRERWKVADWTEDDEDIMSQAAYEWIRMDSDFEWIASLHVEQPDFMWVSQLQRDRDVVAQLQAVQALAQIPNAISSSMLTRTVLVHKYFYRVRTEACHALVNCAIPQLGYLGLFHLLMLFRTSFCIDLPDKQGLTERSHPLDLVCIPRANDFSDPAEYFVKRAMVHAISRVRNDRGRTLPQVKKLLINLLRYNDNSTNRFADDVYVAGLVAALSSALVPVESQHLGGFIPAADDPDAANDASIFEHACTEVARLQELDKLVPSYHNVVSLACLDWHAAMVLSNQLPLDLGLYLSYTQEGSFTPLRLAAFNYLQLLSGLKHRIIVRYLFSVLRDDESRVLKRALSKSICEGLAVAIATGDSAGAPGSRPGDSLVEETSGGDLAAADMARDKEMENTLRSLRREVGRSAAVREGFLSSLLSPDVDAEQRWALIKLAELLFKPAEEKDLPLKPQLSLRIKAPGAKGPQQQQQAPAADSPLSAVSKIKLVHRPSTAGDEASLPGRVAFEDAAAPARKPSLKIKKPKPATPAQAAGMTNADITACRNALKKLSMNKHSPLFMNPVDPVRDGAPNYHKVVKEPMDLSTMGNKLEAGLYPDRFAFEADFALLIRNAKLYTPDPKAYVHKAADALEKAFQVLWDRTNKTLEQAASRQAARESEPESASVAPEAAPPPVQTAPAPQAPPPAAMAPPPVPVRSTPSFSKAPQPASASSPPPAPTAGPKSLGLKLKLKSRNSQGGAPAPGGQEASPKAGSPPAQPSKAAAPTPKSGARSTPNGSSPAAREPPAPTQSSPVAAAATPSQKGANTALPVPPGETADTIRVGRGEPLHTKQCKTLLANIKRMPEAFLFLAPVDETYAPGYFDVVKHPMDLSTMETKLNNGAYKTMADFATDMEQLFTNAHIYADLTAVEHASIVRTAFTKDEWPKAMTRRLEYTEKRTLQGLLGKMKGPHVGVSALFLQPVEEIIAVLPHYFDVVPRSQARDLPMISDRLKADKYGSVLELDADVKLMLANARKFNAGNEGVLDMVSQFETVYNREWRAAGLESNGGGKKRKEGADGVGNGSGGTAKKFKA